MPNYFDTVLDQILFGMKYPRGEKERVKEDGEWVERDIPPEYLGPNARKKARMEASLQEDEMLRYQLGSERSRRKGEKPGMYALADYPGLRNTVDKAQAGILPVGMAFNYYRMDPQQQRAFEQRTRDWAQQQKKILGW